MPTATGAASIAVVARPDRVVLALDRELGHRGIGRGAQGAAIAHVEARAVQHTLHAALSGVELARGQLELFMPECDFIDSAVPDLTLIGVGLAHARHLQAAPT